MKDFITIVAVSILAIIALSSLSKNRWHSDPQFASGEWRIEMQTPPCDSDGSNPTHNIQVLFPKNSGEPIMIECDKMPVNTK